MISKIPVITSTTQGIAPCGAGALLPFRGRTGLNFAITAMVAKIRRLPPQL
jgi:hypothetical protein